jgi:hypothetical protein
MKSIAAFIRLYFEAWAFWLLVIFGVAIAALAADFLTPRLMNLFGLGSPWDAPIKGVSFFGLLAIEAVAYSRFQHRRYLKKL